MQKMSSSPEAVIAACVKCYRIKEYWFMVFPEPTVYSESLTCPPLLICLPIGPGSGSELERRKGKE